MKRVKSSEIEPYVSGIVIDEEGKFIVMKDNLLKNFFRQIIQDELGYKTDENNLNVLLNILLNDLNYLPYMKYSSENGKYNGRNLIIKSLKELNREQLLAIMDLYSIISMNYEMNILMVHDFLTDDIDVSLGEVYEEFLSREDSKMNKVL